MTNPKDYTPEPNQARAGNRSDLHATSPASSFPDVPSPPPATHIQAQTSPVDSPPPLASLDDSPFEPPPWQIEHLLRKSGVTFLVVPPGACGYALSCFFAAHLTGRTAAPFGMVRYPGDVIFSTHTPHLDVAIKASHAWLFRGSQKILVRKTPKAFNWKEPGESIDGMLKNRPPGATAAAIIDAGAMPRNVKESDVEEAHQSLASAAQLADCLVIVVIEASSTNSDPYERIPKNLRRVRGNLLAVPLRSKALVPEESAPSNFLLMRLPETAPVAFAIRFSLLAVVDHIETTQILWGPMSTEDPREIFRRAQAVDYSAAHRTAAQLATELMRAQGRPLSMQELQAVGSLRGIARTTMRDALSTARLLGHLERARHYDGRWFWVIPAVTPLPMGMRISGETLEEDLPF